MGGLFKEYWEQLAALAFSPDYGLFSVAQPGAILNTGNGGAEVFSRCDNTVTLARNGALIQLHLLEMIHKYRYTC